MGFFGAMGKILAGKPVFEAPPAGQAQSGTQDGRQQPNGHVVPAGPKTVPIVRFGRVQYNVSGSNLDVYADVRNESNEPIFLDRILMAGKTWELDAQLRAGESRQFKIYDGPLFQNPPSGYAEIQYRKQSDGDYFADYHEIRTRQEGTQGYIITELLLRGPVKDI